MQAEVCPCMVIEVTAQRCAQYRYLVIHGISILFMVPLVVLMIGFVIE